MLTDPTAVPAPNSNHHPPGPTGPNYDDEDPVYERQSGGSKDIRGAEDCVASLTTYNGGKRACRLQLLLEEHFDVLNLTLWKHDVLMPEEPVSPVDTTVRGRQRLSAR